MTEIQQSPLYGAYMTRLKWTVLTIDGVQIFLRKFPITGGMMKIHRPEKLPSPEKLIPEIKKYRIGTLVIEPIALQNQKDLNQWRQKVSSSVKLYRGASFLPTKTIYIDLTTKEEDIFRYFSEAKRRAVRRANKCGVTVSESNDIQDFIRIKNKSAGLFGFITTTGVKELWNIFGKKNATILFAKHKDTVVGGVLLLFENRTAYYWIAGATKQGKKLFAPTLLVWEALKISKKRGCKTFDFVGVWDERTPKQNRDWFGFTKFKSGFGGKTLYYPNLLAISVLNKIT